MSSPAASPGLLRAAGWIAWLAAGLPVFNELLLHTGRIPPARLVLWGICWLLFPLLGECCGRLATRPGKLACLILASLCALGTSTALPSSFSIILIVVAAAYWAGELALVPVTLIIVGHSAVLFAVYVDHWGARNAALGTLAYFSFQLFAAFSVATLRAEREAREALARTLAELEATQALLADSAKESERLRIARDLHDTLGHHLTALSLNLELAAHRASGEALGAVEKSRRLAKLLLADVRASVSELRGEGVFDLGRALRTLTADLPSPRVHLSVADGLRIAEPTRAQTLLRAAQELATNAARHSGAANLWLELEQTPRGLALRARDDGRGAAAPAPGGGLRGMRERVRACGGELAITTSPGAGFAVEIVLPDDPIPAAA